MPAEAAAALMADGRTVRKEDIQKGGTRGSSSRFYVVLA